MMTRKYTVNKYTSMSTMSQDIAKIEQEKVSNINDDKQMNINLKITKNKIENENEKIQNNSSNMILLSPKNIDISASWGHLANLKNNLEKNKNRLNNYKHSLPLKDQNNHISNENTFNSFMINPHFYNRHNYGDSTSKNEVIKYVITKRNRRVRFKEKFEMIIEVESYKIYNENLYMKGLNIVKTGGKKNFCKDFCNIL